ncbi:alpha/beta hydrolase [Oscillatoriales cyanobacterium LEGE 11467]|uniref:Alpha/beta hydrolase n=1 Tax=Zarconia navalis LEGE 11467 TaxID=1828826 RepID=A0A928W343_9CYAN|nr:alpha/beta hydrolase [Zarconia navalis]MBE9042380.1 alpha/beta hydrolase [Zarconia navalis LEGE 11467]
MPGMRKTVRVGDIDLSYLEWDRGTIPLLLLHGLADNALVWSALADALSDRYHIVAVDMRGHGDSSKPECGYGFDRVIADLEALMDVLGWPQARVIGHSWSGKVATIWATQNPQKLRAMVLVDPIFVYGMPGILRLSFPLFYRLLPFLQGMGPFESEAAAIAKARQMKQYRDWTPLQEAVFRQSIEQKPDGRWGSKFTIAARDRIFDAVLRVPGLTRSVSVPTLFVQPESGVNRYNWQLKPYQKHLSHLEIRRVPGNHWAPLGEPEAFNAAIAPFLERHSTTQTL